MSYSAPLQADTRNYLKPGNKSLWVSGIATFLFVFGVQALSGYLIYRRMGTWSDRSDFGGMFGAVGTFFSGLAFAGVIITIILQMRELRYQRAELAATTRELQRSAKAQESSERALSEQVYLLAMSNYLSVEVQRMNKCERGSLEYQKIDRRVSELEGEMLGIIKAKSPTAPSKPE